MPDLNASEVKFVVAQIWGVQVRALEGQSRVREFARPRMAAMYLCRQLTGLSQPQIGQQFGGRDHTTVIHALRRVPVLAELNAEFRERLMAAWDQVQTIESWRGKFIKECTAAAAIGQFCFALGAGTAERKLEL